MSGRSRESHPEVWKGSGDPPEGQEGNPSGGPRGVGRHTRGSGRVQMAHPEDREGSGGKPGGPGGVNRPIRRSGRGRYVHP